ncbi:O-methyltransferase [Yinghuangia seranimata]|uniref:O-methyltransferase n=1 Tax=Yinghuangia seranimata TaxID=408067 RepID=UPI00248CB779|nr:class I SAM-dependent methyltransferase [Yinghuangia seranimata]MDI2127826.1 class I SAM-dependent methyltransferase [Yinghuangia seranimata]
MTPTLRERAHQHARDLGFTLSSNDTVGRLLAVLAAAVPSGGRILELGTGTGVGTAALVAGLGGRTDATVTSVEYDEAVAARAADNAWPSYVALRTGDAVELLPGLGTFHLVYADAPGGKWTGLDLTIAALEPGGVLLVDDMTPLDRWSDEHRVNQAAVRETLVTHPDLLTCELADGEGLVLCTRRAG